jgi:hypothetical protein
VLSLFGLLEVCDMSVYNPEEWMLVRITGTHPHYRVFGSWRGGYLNGDSWRLNSGIVSVNRSAEDNDILEIHGHTGSIYEVHTSTYGIRSPYNRGELDGLVERSGNNAFVIEDISIDEILATNWSM